MRDRHAHWRDSARAELRCVMSVVGYDVTRQAATWMKEFDLGYNRKATSSLEGQRDTGLALNWSSGG